MNSGFNTHTISPKQAEILVKTILDCTYDYKKNIVNSTNLLFQRLSEVWADRNIVSHVNSMAYKIEAALDKLTSDVEKLTFYIKDICDRYNAVSGNKTIDVISILERWYIEQPIDTSKIHETFNADTFGVKNTRRVYQDVYECFRTFEYDTKELTDGFSRDICSINAFGNTNIIAELNRFAANAGTSLKANFRSISKLGKAMMDEVLAYDEIVFENIPINNE